MIIFAVRGVWKKLKLLWVQYNTRPDGGVIFFLLRCLTLQTVFSLRRCLEQEEVNVHIFCLDFPVVIVVTSLSLSLPAIT